MYKKMLCCEFKIWVLFIRPLTFWKIVKLGFFWPPKVMNLTLTYYFITLWFAYIYVSAWIFRVNLIQKHTTKIIYKPWVETVPRTQMKPQTKETIKRTTKRPITAVFATHNTLLSLDLNIVMVCFKCLHTPIPVRLYTV